RQTGYRMAVNAETRRSALQDLSKTSVVRHSTGDDPSSSGNAPRSDRHDAAGGHTDGLRPLWGRRVRREKLGKSSERVSFVEGVLGGDTQVGNCIPRRERGTPRVQRFIVVWAEDVDQGVATRGEHLAGPGFGYRATPEFVVRAEQHARGFKVPELDEYD